MPKQSAIRVLIIEDEGADTEKAITIFNRLGLQIQSKTAVWSARNLLEDIANGEHPAPHLMILDLGFPHESGFEILRYWKSTPALAKISIIVWTQSRELDRHIADLFEVSAVVQKSQGTEALEKELKRVIAGLT
jgi:CheY-like chemotaxis protein